jgi:predicted XRE-type DNA-binding protein
MTDDDIEIVRGSGNVFRDFGYADADVRQAKALLAAQIIKVLDAEALSTRQAEAKTGIAHSEFVRIRNVNLTRFTIDRLVTILGRLGHEVELTVTVHPRTRPGPEADTAHL